MKTRKLIIRNSIIVLSIASLFAIASCKKNSSTTTTTTPPTPKGVIGFHLHTQIGSVVDSILANNYAYPMNDSSFYPTNSIFNSKHYITLKLDTAQLYISNIVLHSSTSNYTVSGQYILKYIGAEGPYIIGLVPTGNYTSVSFNIGLDAMANGMIPGSMTSAFNVFSTTTNTQFNPFSPPATYTDPYGEYGTIAPMWSGNTGTGYDFVNVSGFADTSVAQTGKYQHFSYMLGTSSSLVTINLPTMSSPVTVTTANTNAAPAEIHVICDYGQFFKGITDFRSQNSVTIATSTTPLADTLLKHIKTMFHYE